MVPHPMGKLLLNYYTRLKKNLQRKNTLKAKLAEASVTKEKKFSNIDTCRDTSYGRPLLPSLSGPWRLRCSTNSS
jgi:hypothetical protein